MLEDLLRVDVQSPTILLNMFELQVLEHHLRAVTTTWLLQLEWFAMPREQDRKLCDAQILL